MKVTEYTISRPPPSTNGLFRNVRGKGRVKTDRYRIWLIAMGWDIKQNGPIETIKGPVFVEIGVRRTNSRRDLDNCLKAPLDLLVWMGVIEDDSQIVRILAEWVPDVEGARIRIREVQ